MKKVRDHSVDDTRWVPLVKKIRARHLRYLKERYPARFGSCDNRLELIQRLSWLKDGYLLAHLEGRYPSGAERNYEKSIWEEFLDLLEAESTEQP